MKYNEAAEHLTEQWRNASEGSTASLALHMGIFACKQMAELENPQLLSLVELREMDGEPIWISPEAFDGRWVIADVSRSTEKLYSSLDHYYPLRDYGKTWRAYRHKPKEGNI